MNASKARRSAPVVTVPFSIDQMVWNPGCPSASRRPGSIHMLMWAGEFSTPLYEAGEAASAASPDMKATAAAAASDAKDAANAALSRAEAALANAENAVAAAEAAVAGVKTTSSEH